MKAHVLKLISVVVLSVCLIVSFCSVPVLALSEADGIYSESFNFPTTNSSNFGFAKYEDSFNSNTFEQLRDPVYVSDPGNYINFEFSLPSSYVVGDEGIAYCSLVLGESDFGQTAFTISNVFWVSPFTLKYRYDVPSSIQKYRLSLRTIDSSSNISAPIGYSEWINFSGGSSGTIQIGDTLIPISTDSFISEGGISGFVVCFEFYMTTASFNATSNGSIYLRLEILDGVVTANFSKTENPKIPSFNPPNSDILDESLSLEDDILNSDTVQDVETNTAELFASLDGSLLNFRDGILFVTRCLNIYLVPTSDEDGWFHDLVQISLALGIVATLLGITGSIIGAAVKRRGD